MACLVTEETPALQRAGFVHMENCVFANPPNLVEYVKFLIDNTDLTRQITEAGHRLVYSRHTIRQRSQIFDWFMLNRDRKPGERIIQDCPFGALRLQADRPPQPCLTLSLGLDRKLLLAAAAKLWSGHVQEAFALYQQCLQLVSYLPEAKLGLALCLMKTGRAKVAQRILIELMETTTFHYGAADPDPVEWAYFLICLSCQGRLVEARLCNEMYPTLGHKELSLARFAVRAFCGINPNNDLTELESERFRPSIHQLISSTPKEWLDRVNEMLESSGQLLLAKQIKEMDRCQNTDDRVVEPIGALEAPRQVAFRVLCPNWWYFSLDNLLVNFGLDFVRPNTPPMREFRYLRRLCGRVARRVLRLPRGARLIGGKSRSSADRPTAWVHP